MIRTRWPKASTLLLSSFLLDWKHKAIFGQKVSRILLPSCHALGMVTRLEGLSVLDVFLEDPAWTAYLKINCCMKTIKPLSIKILCLFCVSKDDLVGYATAVTGQCENFQEWRQIVKHEELM